MRNKKQKNILKKYFFNILFPSSFIIFVFGVLGAMFFSEYFFSVGLLISSLLFTILGIRDLIKNNPGSDLSTFKLLVIGFAFFLLSLYLLFFR